MAAVTVATGYPKHWVNGNYREYSYKVNIAADADYLDVPLHQVIDVQMTDDTVSAGGVASTALQTNGQTRITFNSTGAINNCYVRVVGL